MNNLNRVIINGNLTTDCKLERGKNGTAYGGFCIAVNSSETEPKLTVWKIDLNDNGKAVSFYTGA